MTSPNFPPQTDLSVTQGEVFVMSATWKVDGQPKSLDGYVGHLSVRRKPGNFTGTPLIDLWSDGDNPAIELEPGDSTGMVKVTIPGSATALLRKNAYYDLWVVKVDNPDDAVRLAYGQVLISTSATDNSTVAAREGGGVGGGGTGGGTTSGGVSQADFETLAATVAALQQQLSDATTALAQRALASDITAIDTEIDRVTGEVDQVSGEVGTLQTTVTQLGDTVAGLPTGGNSGPPQAQSGTNLAKLAADATSATAQAESTNAAAQLQTAADDAQLSLQNRSASNWLGMWARPDAVGMELDLPQGQTAPPLNIWNYDGQQIFKINANGSIETLGSLQMRDPDGVPHQITIAADGTLRLDGNPIGAGGGSAPAEFSPSLSWLYVQQQEIALDNTASFVTDALTFGQRAGNDFAISNGKILVQTAGPIFISAHITCWLSAFNDHAGGFQVSLLVDGQQLLNKPHAAYALSGAATVPWGPYPQVEASGLVWCEAGQELSLQVYLYRADGSTPNNGGTANVDLRVMRPF